MLLIYTIILILSIIWYYNRVKRMTLLERNGIPGPKPHIIFGNMREYYSKGYNQCFEEWKSKYGRVFGYYLGAKPFIIVTDPELLKLIQIKDFNHFFHRPYVIPGGLYRNWKFHEQVNRVEPYRWKILRQIISPWFSSSQLKTFVPTIITCTEQMIRNIDSVVDNNNGEFNIYTMIEHLTMDIIHRTAFGIKSDIQKSTNNKMIQSTKESLAAKTSEFLASILLIFPEFSIIINIIRDINEKISDYLQLTSDQTLWKSVEAIVDKRLETYDQNNDNKYKDMLELMIDSMDSKSNKKLNKIEIIANCIGINEAAFESPANNIGFVFHHLVNYPEIQEKVIEEIDNLFNESEYLDYNTVNQMHFTEAVINETFRIYPTDPFFISHASDIDYRYEDIIIPKGVDTRVPNFQLHRDKEFWSEADRFNPHRFVGSDNIKNINPLVFQPFGAGPRLCPGKRFTFLEIKIILALVLRKYRFITGSETEIENIELEFKLFSLSPKNGVYVKAIPR